MAPARVTAPRTSLAKVSFRASRPAQLQSEFLAPVAALKGLCTTFTRERGRLTARRGRRSAGTGWRWAEGPHAALPLGTVQPQRARRAPTCRCVLISLHPLGPRPAGWVLDPLQSAVRHLGRVPLLVEANRKKGLGCTLHGTRRCARGVGLGAWQGRRQHPAMSFSWPSALLEPGAGELTTCVHDCCRPRRAGSGRACLASGPAWPPWAGARC